MGSLIEFNDTLQITTEQGFPKELNLDKHLKNPISVKDFKGKVFKFYKPGMRLFHPSPVRVFLVHNINGKWLYWGIAYIVKQTIDAEKNTTSGKYKIIEIYEPVYMRMKNLIDVEESKRFWNDSIHRF